MWDHQTKKLRRLELHHAANPAGGPAPVTATAVLAGAATEAITASMATVEKPAVSDRSLRSALAALAPPTALVRTGWFRKPHNDHA